MSIFPRKIWRVPAYLPYLQPPLTDQTLKEAEGQIGCRLPESYVTLIRQQNGGYIRYTLPDCVHSQIYGIGPHFPSLTAFDWQDSREYVSYELTGLIPFDGDGHWHLCLDYRERHSNPTVTFIDIECDNQREIAPSFNDYLAMLRIDVSERDLFMPSISDLAQTLHDLGGRLGVPFDPPDSNDYGYPVHRVLCGERDNPEWIWISPNLVSRGFVRKNDPRFEELRTLMPGEAPRYPELPESSYLLDTTEGIRAAVLQACKECSIDVRPLIEYVV